MALVSAYKGLLLVVLLLNFLTVVNLPYLAASIYHASSREDFFPEGGNLKHLLLNSFKDGAPACIDHLMN